MRSILRGWWGITVHRMGVLVMGTIISVGVMVISVRLPYFQRGRSNHSAKNQDRLALRNRNRLTTGLMTSDDFSSVPCRLKDCLTWRIKTEKMTKIGHQI